jgi:hypothetical protein
MRTYRLANLIFQIWKGIMYKDRGNTLVSGLFVFISMLLCASFINAQSPTNFSGVWVMDKAKSDADFKSFDVTLTIKQDPQTITLEQTFLMEGRTNKAPSSSFNLDGNVVNKEEQGGVNKTSAKWSADKRVLTLRTIRTMNGSDYGSDAVYKLSDDGKILTIQTISVAPPGGPKNLQVFNKK